ncbi:MAG: DUF4432 family protein [Kiritimatiellae bacterium]|nr:DUF4432 family protein [Kiritimatiellia bacterium]
MKIFLQERFFSDKETEVFSDGELRASLFTYSTGVKAVRLANSKGAIVVLPWMGQMIWRAEFLGRELTMKSIYDEPQMCTIYGESYGCFLMHCGLTAMGNPTAEDTHPGHGELPTARYRSVWLEAGTDAKGAYLAIGGVYSHLRCFATNYDFTPCVKLRPGATKIEVDVTFTNHKDLPLEYFYLCHVNCRPVDGSKLEYSAPRDTIIVNHEVPEDYYRKWAAASNAYLAKLDKNPAIMDRIGNPDESYRPEIVFCVFHKADSDGNAYTMQVHPDGTSVFVTHRPEELPYGVRWIARTKDEDALGMCLPATAEHKGRLYCRAHGQQRMLAPGRTVSYHIETGLQDRAATRAMKKRIDAILSGRTSV